jgi:catechol 2,3-dioxygenase-like lactoylglutathione lyase family enzyme
MLCKKLHHAAFRCKDAAETVKFYTEVLGLKFAHVMGADHVPSTGKYSPHIHIFFEMEDGSNIAFFECPNAPGNMKDLESPDWIQHFAFEVDSVETVLASKKRLEDQGIEVVGVTNHDDFISSIYFFDPSGHRLELTARTCEPERYKIFEAEAYQVLALWNETHDWSQREKAFGGKTGYLRNTV